MGPAYRRRNCGSAGGRSRTARAVSIIGAPPLQTLHQPDRTERNLQRHRVRRAIVGRPGPPRPFKRDAGLPCQGQPNRGELPLAGVDRGVRQSYRPGYSDASPKSKASGNPLVVTGKRSASGTVERRQVQPARGVLRLNERGPVRGHLAADAHMRKQLNPVAVRETVPPPVAGLLPCTYTPTEGVHFWPTLQDTRAPRASPRRSEYRSPPSPRHLPSGARIDTRALRDWNPMGPAVKNPVTSVCMPLSFPAADTSPPKSAPWR